MRECLVCGSVTKNPKFCSRSCSVTNANRVSPKIKARVYTCRDCGVVVTARRKKCKSCNAVKDLRLSEVIYTKHHRSTAYSLVRVRARASTKGMDKVCQKCGYDKHVEVCHIRPISDFPLDSLISEVNHPLNLVLLCPNCHSELDRKK